MSYEKLYLTEKESAKLMTAYNIMRGFIPTIPEASRCSVKEFSMMLDKLWPLEIAVIYEFCVIDDNLITNEPVSKSIARISKCLSKQQGREFTDDETLSILQSATNKLQILLFNHSMKRIAAENERAAR